MSKEKPSPKPARLIALAAAAGLAVGAVAVYVTSAPQGNNPGTDPALTAEAGQCAAKADEAKTLAAGATGEVAAMQASDPQRLDALSFTGPEGKQLSLADFSGKTLLVNIWATWCAPCRAEMPALNALEKQSGGEDFEVLAINVDTGDDAKPKKFLDEIGVDALKLYRDPTMGVFNDLKKRALALGLPVSLLIDKNGCLIANMNGPADWASEDAKKLIDAAKAI